MAHAVHTDEARALIEVCYSGHVSVEQRLDAMQQTLALLACTQFDRILIDYLDATHQPTSFASSNAFAATISNHPVLRHCRIAFVGGRRQQFNAVVEMLADARRYPFRRFYDRDSAIRWLLTDEPALGLLED